MVLPPGLGGKGQACVLPTLEENAPCEIPSPSLQPIHLSPSSVRIAGCYWINPQQKHRHYYASTRSDPSEATPTWSHERLDVSGGNEPCFCKVLHAFTAVCPQHSAPRHPCREPTATHGWPHSPAPPTPSMMLGIPA
eukprot:Sspe_Gene.102371::Locus_77477_Transcript_1_1_Confidence_1.000_Length_523::g.102371::m.102371